MSARFILVAAGLAACSPVPRASETPSAAASQTMPLRYAPSNGVITVDFEAIRHLTIRPPFTYLGGQRFILGGTADAEQHLFVVADGEMVVKRLYWIQIEEMLASSSDLYDYRPDSLVAFHGFTLAANFRTYAESANPGSDRARAFDFITAQGYTIPTGGTRVRLIHLPGVRARREIMLIYLETDPTAANAPHASLVTRAADGIILRGP